MHFEPLSTAQIQAQLASLETYTLPAALVEFEPGPAPAMASAGMRSLAPRNFTPGGDTPDASVIANGVVSFVGGMSEQNKQDVRNSYLYATLVATAAYPSEQDGTLWYGKFAEVMNTLGWAFTDKRYSRYQSRDTGLSMDKVGLQILASVITSAAIPGAMGGALLKAAGAAMDGLKNSDNSKPLSLFNRSASKSETGQFTLGTCGQDADGGVVMAFSTFHCRSSESRGNVLFARWNNASTAVYTGQAKIELNPQVYAFARDRILQILADRVLSAIASYEI